MPALFKYQHFEELTESDRDIVLAGIAKGIDKHQFMRVTQAPSGNINVRYINRYGDDEEGKTLDGFVSPHYVEHMLTGECGGLSIDDAEAIVLDALKTGIDAPGLRDHLERAGMDVIFVYQKGYVWFVVSRWDGHTRHYSDTGKTNEQCRWSETSWVLDLHIGTDGDMLKSEPIQVVRR